MTTKISTLSLKLLRTEEDFGFMKLVDAELENLPTGSGATTGSGSGTTEDEDRPSIMSADADEESTTSTGTTLDAAVEEFEAAFYAFDAALKQATVTEASTALIAADEVRDRAWRVAYAFAKAQTDHPAESVATVARRIKAAFDKYGNPTQLPRTEESGVLHNLLQDLATFTTEQQTTSGFAPYLAALSTAEDAYLAALNTRVAEKVERITGIVKISRTSCDAAYRKLTNLVNALITVNGYDKYSAFVERLNVHIQTLKTVLKARQTKSAASTTEGGTTTGTGDRPDIM